MPEFKCQAILFDFDGVLVDSDQIYDRHWTRWALEHGIEPQEILSIHHGRPSLQSMGIVAPHLNVIEESKVFNAEVESDENLDGVEAYEGVKEALLYLPEDRWAVGTSATRAMVLPKLAYLDLPQAKVLVTADDVVQGKPNPEPYLKAAQGLGVDPKQCVIVEDSPAGLQAAKAAGAMAIAVATTHKPEALTDADVILNRFLDLCFFKDENGLTLYWANDLKK